MSNVHVSQASLCVLPEGSPPCTLPPCCKRSILWIQGQLSPRGEGTLPRYQMRSHSRPLIGAIQDEIKLDVLVIHSAACLGY